VQGCKAAWCLPSALTQSSCEAAYNKRGRQRAAGLGSSSAGKLVSASMVLLPPAATACMPPAHGCGCVCHPPRRATCHSRSHLTQCRKTHRHQHQLVLVLHALVKGLDKAHGRPACGRTQRGIVNRAARRDSNCPYSFNSRIFAHRYCKRCNHHKPQAQKTSVQLHSCTRPSRSLPVPSTTMRFLPPPLGAVSSRDGQPGCCLAAPFRPLLALCCSCFACAACCWGREAGASSAAGRGGARGAAANDRTDVPTEPPPLSAPGPTA